MFQGVAACEVVQQSMHIISADWRFMLWWVSLSEECAAIGTDGELKALVVGFVNPPRALGLAGLADAVAYLFWLRLSLGSTLLAISRGPPARLCNMDMFIQTCLYLVVTLHLGADGRGWLSAGRRLAC